MADGVKTAGSRDETGRSKTEHYLQYVDLISDWTGRIFSFAFLPLTFVAVFEVVSRYVFNKPTIWAWDINIQLSAIIVLFGGGYTFFKGEHVIVDIFITRLSRRKRAVVDMVTGLLVLFGIGILVWKAADMGWQSFLSKEKLSSIWEPPIYPLKMLVPVGALVLFLQVLAKFIRDFVIAVQPGGRGR